MRNLEEIKSTNNLQILAEAHDGIKGLYFDRENKKTLTFIFSWGGGWEHLSVSMPHKTPSWDQMCMMKNIFFNEEECCVEYHPRKSDYVNNHAHCLHIWRPIGQEIIIPPKIFV